MQASTTIKDCDQIDVSASATATTFYGIPEPVTNARVVNDNITSDCVIEWEFENNDLVSLKYLVKYLIYTKTYVKKLTFYRNEINPK